MTEYDPVNRPKHYNDHPSGVECITVTEHMSFNIGNAIKYLWRAGKKSSLIEDLRKAIWYINREIQRIEVLKKLELEEYERGEERIKQMIKDGKLEERIVHGKPFAVLEQEPAPTGIAGDKLERVAKVFTDHCKNKERELQKEREKNQREAAEYPLSSSRPDMSHR